MTSEKAPELIWATTAREGYDTIHSEWPPEEWPPEDHPYDYPPAEYIKYETHADLVATKDARIAELERHLDDAAQAIEWGARRMESKSQAMLMEKWAAEYRAALSREGE